MACGTFPHTQLTSTVVNKKMHPEPTCRAETFRCLWKNTVSSVAAPALRMGPGNDTTLSQAVRRSCRCAWPICHIHMYKRKTDAEEANWIFYPLHVAAKVFWPQKGPSSTVLKKKKSITHIFLFIFGAQDRNTWCSVWCFGCVCKSVDCSAQSFHCIEFWGLISVLKLRTIKAD